MSEFPRDFGGYTLLAELGRGGMGVVYRAEQKSLGRAVALKVLSVSAEWASEETLARFRRESEIMAKLAHPDIVAVYDCGLHQDKPYIAMELMRGSSLEKYLREQKPPLEKSLAALAKVARALHYAHEQGIIHRDIKPSNILMDDEGRPKLTDFGLAKIEGSRLSLSGALLGTPVYMSPEQAGRNTELVDARTDVYGLGAVMYEMLTGSAPFEGSSVEAIIHHVIHSEPGLPRVMSSGVPRDAETICMKALEKDRNRRYPTALAFAQDLERFLAGEPILARPPGPVERAWRWGRRHKAISVLVPAAVLATVSAVVVFRLTGELRKQEREAARIREDQRKSAGEQKRLEDEQRRAERLRTLESEGSWLLERGEAGAALDRFETLILEDGRKMKWLQARATCLWILRRHDKAEEDWDAVLAQESGDAAAWRLRGLNLIDAARFKEAVACYRRTAELRKVPAASLAADNQDFDVLIALVEAGEERYRRKWYAEYDPSILTAAPQKAYPLSKKWWEEDFPGGLRYRRNVEDLPKTHGDHPAALHRFAVFQQYAGTNGIPAIEKCLEFLPIWPKAWTLRALILKRAAGNPVEIQASYSHAMDLCPRLGDALWHLGEWLYSSGKFDDALPLFQRILDRWEGLRWEETDVQAHRKMSAIAAADCLAALGRKDEALDLLRRWKAIFGRFDVKAISELSRLRGHPGFDEFIKSLE